MIVLTVLSLNGTASAIAPVQFDELGGSIGRADSNQLVLPDQDRTISRLHAQLVFRNGGYALIDLGANAVLHNGQPIGHGREVAIQAGDAIEIGGYKIAVSLASPIAREHDPFAGFESDMAAASGSYPRTIPPPALRPASPAAAPAAKAPAPYTPAPAAGIPDDWDPFAADQPPAFAAGHSSATPFSTPFAAPLPVVAPAALAMPGGEPSLDDLFGLGAPVTPAPAPAASGHDHVPEMNVPWTGVFAVPKPQPAPVGLTALPLDEPLDLGLDLALEVAEPVTQAPAPADRAAFTPAATPAATPTALTAAAAARPAPPPELPADAQALVGAFLDGLGVDDLRLRPLTPEAMRELGQVLRAYTHGTMDLLVARGALKKEVRADVTMMAAQANNVLKFSPTVEFALQHLLATRRSGFMGSLDSVEDAFEDLKSHQLGVMAGMHAALQGVLKRFDPAEIEKKVGSQSGLFGLVSSGRKAKLWELFQEMYGQSASQAREEFDDLFGKAFAREYDRFVAELSSKAAPKKP